MPRPKRESLENESPATQEEEFVNYHDDESGFGTEPSTRISTIVTVPTEARRGKGKRSLEDMMGSMPNPMAQSAYALERLGALEDQMAKVLALCSEEARELVFKQRPSMRKYVEDEKF